MKALLLIISLAGIALAACWPAVPLHSAVFGSEATAPVVSSPGMSPTDTHVITVVLSTLIPIILYLLKERYPALFVPASTIPGQPASLVTPPEVTALAERIKALEAAASKGQPSGPFSHA